MSMPNRAFKGKLHKRTTILREMKAAYAAGDKALGESKAVELSAATDACIKKATADSDPRCAWLATEMLANRQG